LHAVERTGMRYLTVEQVLFLHARLIAETGGSHGLRDLELLQSAIAHLQARFQGVHLYPDLFTQAAALLHSLVCNHPFVDGNKRTGITAAALFLRSNGHRLTVSDQEMETFTMGVARGEMPLEAITNWLRKNSTMG
jgi:death-on-curing protein